MKRFTNILLVAGGDNWQETTLERAVSLAKENQADLTVVDVIELSRDLEIIAREKMDRFRTEIVSKRLVQLDNMVQHVQDSIKVRTRVVQGTAFLEIIRAVLQDNYDLVMKMSGSRRRLKNLLLGSTDMHLLRKCPCPVWLMKQGESTPYKRVLAALDIEPESGDQQKHALNKQIMEMASSLALSEFGKLYIIHAWMRNESTILDGIGSDFDDDEMEGWGDKTRQLHRSWLDGQEWQLLEMLGQKTMDFLAPQLHMVEGETCEVITEFVEKKLIDVVVMGTLARSGISGLFMGNTAESILNTIDCSVLAVKPPGFVTPVSLTG